MQSERESNPPQEKMGEREREEKTQQARGVAGVSSVK